MSIVTFKYIIFLFCSVLIYYISPKKQRWIILLLISIFFFLLASGIKMILFLMLEVLIVYCGIYFIDKYKDNLKLKKKILIITLILVIGMLSIFKYINFIPLTLNSFGNLFNINFNMKKINILAPIGISYYTLSLIGYVMDSYWGVIKPTKNIFKLTLFTAYYPILISGPIIRYNEVEEELFNGNKLNFDNIYQGFYRVIYGLMKKMVIADSLALIVKNIFADYHTFSNLYIIYGVVLYAIQIYNDFSGCMDIVIGSSKMFGVTLPENFKSPFLSLNLSEFWRRWHITLGTWGKDYIMYPILKSDRFQRLTTKCKSKYGKKLGKKIPTIISIFILWLLIGLWHGVSFRYVLAAGIIPWVYLTVGQLFDDVPEKLNKLLRINTNAFSFRIFRSIRTLMFMCFIWLIVCAGSVSNIPDLLKSIFVLRDLHLFSSLPTFDVPIMLLVVLFVDILIYKNIDPFELFQKQNFLFRWIVLFSLIIVILLHGYYGPFYNPLNFIYGGF